MFGRTPRSYGPRGCLLTLVLIGVLVLFFEVFYDMLDRNAPSTDQLQTVANDFVRRQLIDQPIAALTVVAIHSRKKRFSISTDRWAVEGEVLLRATGSGDAVRRPYVAVLHRVCDDLSDPRCWVLEQLTYGDEIIRLRDAPGSVIN